MKKQVKKNLFGWGGSLGSRAGMVLLILMFALCGVNYAALTYYVAPQAQGLGDGSSLANAMQYWNETLWSTIKNDLSGDDVNVIFANSNEYGNNTTSRRALYLQNTGDPYHTLTLSGASQSGTIWNYSSTNQPFFIKLEGCQNVKIEKMTFQGTVSNWGVSLVPASAKPTRNITIDQCTFQNLTTAYYGALGISDGTRDVWVTSCTFSNVGIGATSHMIYGVRAQKVVVASCSFSNCKGPYIKVRNDSDYWVIRNSTFSSSANVYDCHFIDICTLNSVSNNYDPADPMEYFGYFYRIWGNSFTGYSSANGIDAVIFRGRGYDPYDLSGIRLDATEGYKLQTGTTSKKREIMWDNLAIRGGKVIMYSNTFTRTRCNQSYEYQLGWNSTSNGWVDYADIYDTSNHTVGATLDTCPAIRNGDFEMKGYPTRYWRYNNEGSRIHISHTGLNGTSKAVLLDRTLDTDKIYQWIFDPQSSWQIDACFALGHFSGTGKKFAIDIVDKPIGDRKISIGVDDQGRIGMYSGSGNNFNIISGLGTVSFSSDNNNDGDYSDAGDNLYWYRIRITGDYVSSPSVSVQMSDANTYTLNANKLVSGLTYWVNGTPPAGAFPGTIAFETTYCDAIVDEVAFE